MKQDIKKTTRVSLFFSMHNLQKGWVVKQRNNAGSWMGLLGRVVAINCTTVPAAHSYTKRNNAADVDRYHPNMVLILSYIS